MMKENYPNVLQSFKLFGLYLLINIVLAFALIGAGTSEVNTLSTMISMILANATLIFIILNFKFADRGSVFKERPSATFLTYLLTAFFVIFFILFMDPIVSAVPMPDLLKEMFEKAIQKDIWSFMTISIVAPVTEELIFRRLMLPGLVHNYGVKKGILWSAFFFALFHLNPWQGLVAFLIGIFLGWLYIKTKDIWLCIFLHFVNNTLSFLAFYYSDDVSFSIVDLTGYDFRLALIMGLSLIGMYFCYRFINNQIKISKT